MQKTQRLPVMQRASNERHGSTLLARDPRALSAVGRIFVQEIFRWQRERAELDGILGARGGAICFPQRFGGSLNLNVHYHVAAPDGVFTLRDHARRAEFHSIQRPTPIDLQTVALNVDVRVTSWLRRRGLLSEGDGSDPGADAAERSALDACLEGSLGVGELSELPGRALRPVAQASVRACPLWGPARQPRLLHGAD